MKPNGDYEVGDIVFVSPDYDAGYRKACVRIDHKHGDRPMTVRTTYTLEGVWLSTSSIYNTDDLRGCRFSLYRTLRSLQKLDVYTTFTHTKR